MFSLYKLDQLKRLVKVVLVCSDVYILIMFLFISEYSEEGVNVKIQRKYIGLQNKIKSLFSLIIF